MPQVNITIAGRIYRMACGEGEEPHLSALAERLDDRIGRLRRDFGEIGDQRITVMAAITVLDDLSEAEMRIAVLRGEITALREEREQQDRRLVAITDAVAATLDGVSDEIDGITSRLAAGGEAQLPSTKGAS